MRVGLGNASYWLITVALSGLVGCGGDLPNNVRKAFYSNHPSCRRGAALSGDLVGFPLGQRRYRIEGCGLKEMYLCPAGANSRWKSCSIERERIQTGVLARSSGVAPVAGAAREVRRVKRADGSTLLARDVDINGITRLELRALPDKYPDTVSLIFTSVYNRTESPPASKACALWLLLDGTPVAVREALYPGPLREAVPVVVGGTAFGGWLGDLGVSYGRTLSNT